MTGVCAPTRITARGHSGAVDPIRDLAWRGAGCTVRTRVGRPPRTTERRCRPTFTPSCSRTSRAAPACGSRKGSAWPPRSPRHDARAHGAVERNRGVIVKTTGDGLYAVFADPLDAVNATVELQQSLVDPAVTNGIPIRVRCGLHLGAVERRDNDYFGTPGQSHRADHERGARRADPRVAGGRRRGPRAPPGARRRCATSAASG